MEHEIITSKEDLLQLVKDGLFLNFCIAFALNKGYRNVIREKKEVRFSIGDYEVIFEHAQMCFVLTHKIYFARIITVYFTQVVFIGDSEEEVIKDLVSELEKDLLKK